jgi:hypothetical protein
MDIFGERGVPQVYGSINNRDYYVLSARRKTRKLVKCLCRQHSSSQSPSLGERCRSSSDAQRREKLSDKTPDAGSIAPYGRSVKAACQVRQLVPSFIAERGVGCTTNGHAAVVPRRYESDFSQLEDLITGAARADLD